MNCARCDNPLDPAMSFCPRCGGPTGKTIPAPAAPPPRPGDLSGRVLAGRYQLLDKLGQGGMGVVYRCKDLTIDREIAVKVLNPELANDPRFVKRFTNEARLASRIEVEHALKIYDFGKADDGLLYLAMELLRGEPLTAEMKRQRQCPLERAAYVVGQAAEILDAAHERGIIHRDLKPDNIMICPRRNKPDRVVVLDFGIAKQVTVGGGYDTGQTALTQMGAVIGTPEYMSPEQVVPEEAGGKPLDARSDVYTLALVAYEMLAGVIPFPGQARQQKMYARLTDAPWPLAQFRPDLPREVQEVIAAALDRRPEQRPRSAGEFAERLRTAARSRPVAPAPTEIAYPAPAPPFYASPPAPRTPLPLTTPQYTPPTTPAPTPPFDPPAPRARSKAPLLAAVVVLALLAAGGAGAYYVLNSPAATNKNGSLANQNVAPANGNARPANANRLPPPAADAEQTAAALRNAVAAGRLVTLADDDAFTYYYQLKELDARHAALGEVAPRVLPELLRLGEDTLRRKAALTLENLTADGWARTARAYRWARELRPGDAKLEARQRYAEGEQALPAVRREDYTAENTRAAADAYQDAAEKDPDWALPRYSLGVLTYLTPRAADAILHFERAIELDPDWPLPYSALGTAYLSLKDPLEAEKWYNLAIEKNPRWPVPYAWLGELYERQGDYEQAMGYLNKAISLDPKSVYLRDVNALRQRVKELEKKS